MGTQRASVSKHKKPSGKPDKKPVPRGLVQFHRDKKRATCVLCKLPKVLREEIAGARTRKIPRMEVIEWLAAEYKIHLTGAQMDAHHCGRHDSE